MSERNSFRALCLLAFLCTVFLMAAPAGAAPRWVGPEILTPDKVDSVLSSRNDWSVQNLTDAVIYADEDVVLWFDPSDGGSLRGIWVIEDGQVLQAEATDGSVSAVNLLNDEGYFLDVAPEIDWEVAEEPRVDATPGRTYVTFVSLAYTIDDASRLRPIPIKSHYLIHENRRLIDVRFEVESPRRLAPLAVGMQTFASPLPEGEQDRQSRPLTGFSCAAWDSSVYTKLACKDDVVQNKDYSALPGHFSIVLLANDINNGIDEYRVYPSGLRDRWVSLYNGNWDDRGYKFGIDYSLVREFNREPDFRWVSVSEELEEEPDGGKYFTLTCDIALPNPAGRAPLVWQERLFINRGDYQSFLRMTGR